MVNQTLYKMQVSKINEVHLKVETEPSIARETDSRAKGYLQLRFYLLWGNATAS